MKNCFKDWSQSKNHSEMLNCYYFTSSLLVPLKWWFACTLLGACPGSTIICRPGGLGGNSGFFWLAEAAEA